MGLGLGLGSHELRSRQYPLFRSLLRLQHFDPGFRMSLDLGWGLYLYTGLEFIEPSLQSGWVGVQAELFSYALEELFFSGGGYCLDRTRFLLELG